MSKAKKKALKVFKQMQSDSHRTRKPEPFESVFEDIIDVYNECVSYLKAAKYRHQQVTALPTSSVDEFETVTRDQYIKEHLYEKDTNIVSS